MIVPAQKIILTEPGYQTAIITEENLNDPAIYINDSFSPLRASQELSMDATYGTINVGMDLVAVLAEVDGTCIPLGYFFTGIKQDSLTGLRLPVRGFGSSCNCFNF